MQHSARAAATEGGVELATPNTFRAGRDEAVAKLLGLRWRDIWRFLASQNGAYWAICIYLFVEYVRPQELWSPVSGLPLAQLSLVAALLARLLSGKGLSAKGAASWLFLVFTGVILVSSALAQNPSDAFGDLNLWFSWVVIYFLITNVVDSEPRVLFYVMLWMLFHLYMSQGGARQFITRGFSFASYGLVGAPGWFQNSGEFGIAMCMLLVVSVHFFLAGRRHLAKWKQVAFLIVMPGSAILCVVGSSDRGDLLALGALGVWALLRTRYRVRALIVLAVLGLGVWKLVPEGSKERFSVMGQDSTSVSRLTYWKHGLEMAAKYPLFGVGYNNWLSYYGAHYPERVGAYEGVAGKFAGSAGTVEVSHNEFIECVSQLGYVGLATFLLLIVATFVTNYQTRKRARAGPGPPDEVAVQLAFALDGSLVALLAGGFFIAILFYPFFWINLALTVALSDVTRRGRPVVPVRRRSGAVRPPPVQPAPRGA